MDPNPERENHSKYIREAIRKGSYCEVDVYGKVDGSLWLGHDGPSIKQMISF